MYYTFGIDLDLVVLSFLDEPLCPEVNRKGTFREWSFSHFLQYLSLFKREMVARHRIKSPDSKFEYGVPLP